MEVTVDQKSRIGLECLCTRCAHTMSQVPPFLKLKNKNNYNDKPRDLLGTIPQFVVSLSAFKINTDVDRSHQDRK